MSTTAPAPARDVASCCSAPVTAAPLPVAEARALARTLKALADPARLRLLSLIAATEDGQACVCDLTGPVALSQPTVSHHLKTLVDAGLLTRERRGSWAFYALVPGALDAVADALRSGGSRARG